MRRAYSLVQKALHSGIVSIAKNTEREPLFNWIGPLASSQTFFYKLKANKQLSINNQKDAKQFSLGTVIGDIYESLVNEIDFKTDEIY